MTVLILLLVVVILFCEPRLRGLLASEENEYFTEMQLKEETIEEKKDRMRDKIRLLREKKEKERQEFVAEKLDQQFR